MIINEETQGENLESEVITESGNIGEGAVGNSINYGPGGDTRLAIMEDVEDLTKGVAFGKGIVKSD